MVGKHDATLNKGATAISGGGTDPLPLSDMGDQQTFFGASFDNFVVLHCLMFKVLVLGGYISQKKCPKPFNNCCYI